MPRTDFLPKITSFTPGPNVRYQFENAEIESGSVPTQLTVIAQTTRRRHDRPDQRYDRPATDQTSRPFLAEMLGRPAPTRFGHFDVVELDNGVSLDFADPRARSDPSTTPS